MARRVWRVGEVFRVVVREHEVENDGEEDRVQRRVVWGVLCG